MDGASAVHTTQAKTGARSAKIVIDESAIKAFGWAPKAWEKSAQATIEQTLADAYKS